MASPPKPWEKPGVNRQSDERPLSTFMSGGAAPTLDTSFSASSPSLGGGDVPPPVPSRTTSSSYSGYGGYNSPYSSYGGGYGGGYSSPYSMYSSPYSSMYGGGGYGMGYGMGYNRFGNGPQNNEYNSFSRMAEESSRPAFQSIESIVGAFSSVSMMLDSTFQAVYNSFRAVIGVADNFSRMKMQFAQIFSAFAIIRTLRYLYRRFLVLIRLRRPGFEDEVWAEASDQLAQSAAASRPDGKKSSWPVFMFFAIILGGPWLIWKFLQKTFSNPENVKEMQVNKEGPEEGPVRLKVHRSFGPAVIKTAMHGWANGTEDHFVARALYNFEGQGTDELNFKAGANIFVAPKESQPRMKGWLLASVDGKSVGLIPANYVKVLGKRRGTGVTQMSQLPTLPEETQNIPNDSFPVTGPQAPSSDFFQSNTTNSGTSQNLMQSPSALNLQNEALTGLSGDNSVPDMNAAFSDVADPLNLNSEKSERDQ